MPYPPFEDFKFLSSSGEPMKASDISLGYERKSKKPSVTVG
jgi:hypothetical protein